MVETAPLIEQATARMNATERVFGAPIEKDGATIILAAAVRGQGGGGRRGFRRAMAETAGEPGQEPAVGGGFRLAARPVGAFVFRGGSVQWRPAIDVNRIIAGAQLAMGAVAFLVARSLWRRRRI